MLKESGIPFYYQIETILRRRILSGALAAGMPFPNEEALQKEFGVSRITVRHALSSLEQEGVISRKRGKGTFVSAKDPMVRGEKLTGSMESLLAMVVGSQVQILEIGMVDPLPSVRENLRIEEGMKVLRIRKVRILEGNPFSYVVNYFPEEIGQRLTRKELEAKSSVSQILEQKLGIHLDEAVETVEATIADAEEAALLDVRFGDPLLKVLRTVFDKSKKPIEYVSVLYRADRYSFTIRLKRKRLKDTSCWDMGDRTSQ